jgi:mannosyltransferase OCH1-like enzyme
MKLSCNLAKLRLSGKRVVCFGAGKILENTLNKYGFLQDLVEFVVDNDSAKIGKILEIFGKKYQICSIEKYINLKDSYVLLITANYAHSLEICKQLGQIEKLKDVDCYMSYGSHETFLPLPYEMPKILPDSKMKIPKKIHYCWFSGEEIPDENKKWIESWNKFCPDYEILLWNTKNYDITKNRYMYDAYKEKKWAFASDFARLDIVYNNGGIYLDSDVEIIKNFDGLLYDEAFFGFERDFYIDPGSGFGSIKYNRIIFEILETYNNISFYNTDGSLNPLPIPQIVTPIFIKYGLVKENILQMINGVRIYPTDVLSPKDWKTRELDITDNTHSIHHYQASWFSEKMRENHDNSLSNFLLLKKMIGDLS